MNKKLQREGSEPESNDKNQKKTIKKPRFHKEFYTCFCSKIYYSFSSLFLHCQINHKKNIALNLLREVKNQWKGKFKHTYIQFVEDYDYRLSESRIQDKKKTNFKKLIVQKQDPQLIVKVEPEQSDKKREKMIGYRQDNIIENLKRYQIFSRLSQGLLSEQQLHSLLQKLIEFIDQNYKVVQETEYENYCLESSCQNIPLFLNHLWIQQLNKEQPLTNRELDELQKLARWLYQQNKSEYLAELKQEYKN